MRGVSDRSEEVVVGLVLRKFGVGGSLVGELVVGTSLDFFEICNRIALKVR